MSVKKFIGILGVALWMAVQTQVAHAVSFSGLVAFGDSLTDTGGTGTPPYAPGRYSNGPIWIDGLASGLGLSSLSSDFGGTNFAVGGAKTADMFGQITAYSTSVGGVANPNALYILWGGGNDAFGGVSPLTAAHNIGLMISNLKALGAQYFLVPNLPNLALTPAGGGSAGAAAFTNAFNATLASDLAAVTGATVFPMDVFSTTNAIVANPASYGFTNVVNPCFAGTVCATPGTYLWWDALHPTTAAHSLVANLALTAIPEPGTAALVMVGMIGVIRVGRLRAARA